MKCLCEGLLFQLEPDSVHIASKTCTHGGCGRKTRRMYIIYYVCSWWWGGWSVWFMHDSWDFHSSRFSCLQPLNLVSVDFMNECHDLSTSGCCWLSKTDVPGNCFFDAAAYEAGCTLPKCLGAGQNVSCLLTGSLCGSKSEIAANTLLPLTHSHRRTLCHELILSL